MSGDLLELIKSEYLGTKASLRELSERYNVSFAALRATAYRDGWKDKRKAINEARGDDSELRTKIYTVEQTAQAILQNVAAVAEIERDPLRMRQLALTLKDVAELIGYLNPTAKREANARIAKLETEAKRLETGAEPIEIVIKDDDLKEWAK